MATYTPVRMAGPIALTTSSATVYTVGVGKTAASKQFIFNNTSASAVTVTLNLVPNGGSLLTSNQVLSATSVPANSQLIWAADIPMIAGDSFQALASTAAVVNLIISGIEIQ